MKNIPTFDEFINEDYNQIINEGLDADIIKKLINYIRKEDISNVTRDDVKKAIEKLKFKPQNQEYVEDKVLVQFGVNPLDEDWWANLSSDAQDEYIKNHPNSDKAKSAAEKSDITSRLTKSGMSESDAKDLSHGIVSLKKKGKIDDKDIEYIENLISKGKFKLAQKIVDAEFNKAMHEGYKFLEPSTKIGLQNKLTGDRIPGYGYYGGTYDQDFTASYDISAGECAFMFDDDSIFTAKTKSLSLTDFDDIIGKVQKEKMYKKFLVQKGFEQIN